MGDPTERKGEVAIEFVGWFNTVSYISYAIIALGVAAMIYHYATTGSALRLGLSFTGGTDITASFYNSVDLGPYEEDDCTISYTYLGSAVPISPPIAAGRIWGHVNCPKAVDSGQNNGTGAVTCPASADFLFEQCNQ